VSAKQLAYISLFIALTILLTRYYNFHIKFITFSGFPIILAGIYLGPASGALVGVVSDVVGYLLNSRGKPFFPGFTLTAALSGFLPAFCLKIWKKDKPIPDFLPLLLSILGGQFITDVILVPYFMSILYGKPLLWIKMIESFLAQLVHAPIYTFLIRKILKAFYIGKNVALQ